MGLETENQVVRARGVGYSTPDGRNLQSNLNFELKPGQLLLIRGGNGCGKSTLIKALLGEWPLDAGTLEVGVPPTRRQFIPQLENTEIHFPLVLRDVLLMNSSHPNWDLVEGLGLLSLDSLNTAWNTASGGERKRTLLTRAILAKPRLLILDEPMNHLDGGSRQAMIRAMTRFLQGPEPGAIVMVCHQGLAAEEARGFDFRELDLGQRYWGQA